MNIENEIQDLVQQMEHFLLSRTMNKAMVLAVLTKLLEVYSFDLPTTETIAPMLNETYKLLIKRIARERLESNH